MLTLPFLFAVTTVATPSPSPSRPAWVPIAQPTSPPPTIDELQVTLRRQQVDATNLVYHIVEAFCLPDTISAIVKFDPQNAYPLEIDCTRSHVHVDANLKVTRTSQ